MKTILEITKKYSGKIDHLDLELLIAHSLGKSREFVIAHPENAITRHQSLVIEKSIKRRIGGEPLAYITGSKEFYGLEFKVNKYTLIPRPETEMLVDEALELFHSYERSMNVQTTFIDIGTGSGNIIVSIAKTIEGHKSQAIDNKYYAIDKSKKTLQIAKENARSQKVLNKIRFLHGSLLSPLIKNSKFKIQNSKIIILANLPYLSDKIYFSAPKDVKKFEPKSALYSPKQGLCHYEKLFKQLKKILLTIDYQSSITLLIEFSPEQKKYLEKTIKNIFPNSKTEFKKDLSGKWRIAKIRA